VAPPVPCFTSGPFVKVFYAFESGHANRLATLRARITQVVAAADDEVARSAASVGLAIRHVRWLMDANCDLSITAVAISSATSRPPRHSRSHRLVNGGKLASNEKALVFTDDPGASCQGIAGIASVTESDSPLASNPANSGRYIARVFGWCLNDPSMAATEVADIAGHEVMHTMGCRPTLRAHTSHAYHCTDGDDIMCYNDGAGEPTATCPVEFPRASTATRDDYFNPSPAAGTYLAGHWNTANNVFLSRATATSASSTAPIVAITSPAAGASAAGDFNVSASVTDPGGRRSRGWTSMSTATCSPRIPPPVQRSPGNHSCRRPLSLPERSLTIDAVAYDVAGRWKIAPEVALTLANPRVNLTAPGDSGWSPVQWPGARSQASPRAGP